MFNNVQFNWPAALGSIASDCDSALANGAAELTAAGARLTATPPLTVVNNPVAGACAGSAAVLQQLREILFARASILVVHPWAQGVGQGNNHHRYLSPENAVIAAGNKFGDMADIHKPGMVMDALVLLLTGTGFAGFAQTLNQFNAVFPLPQTLLCERRARQLATVETDKQVLPDAALNPPWLGRAVSGIGLAVPACTRVGELCAAAVGYEADGVSLDAELQSLIAKKNLALADASAAIENIASTFTGGVGRGDFFASQNPQQIKNALLNNGVGHDEPLACCVVISAAAGELQMLKEMLGL